MTACVCSWTRLKATYTQWMVGRWLHARSTELVISRTCKSRVWRASSLESWPVSYVTREFARGCTFHLWPGVKPGITFSFYDRGSLVCVFFFLPSTPLRTRTISTKQRKAGWPLALFVEKNHHRLFPCLHTCVPAGDRRGYRFANSVLFSPTANCSTTLCECPHIQVWDQGMLHLKNRGCSFVPIGHSVLRLRRAKHNASILGVRSMPMVYLRLFECRWIAFYSHFYSKYDEMGKKKHRSMGKKKA